MGYLVVHTLLSAAMFWLYSKEYERVRTRLFTTFRIYSTVWLMFLWLGLPFFPVFITELRVVSTFFNLSFTAVVLLFSLLLLFLGVLIMLLLCLDTNLIRYLWYSLVATIYII